MSRSIKGFFSTETVELRLYFIFISLAIFCFYKKHTLISFFSTDIILRSVVKKGNTINTVDFLLNKIPHLLSKHPKYGFCIWNLKNNADLGSLSLVYSNKSANKILGYDIQGYIGSTINEKFFPLLETEIPATIVKVIFSQIPQYIYEIKYNDGNTACVPLFIKFYPIDSRHIICFFKRIESYSIMEGENKLVIASSIDILMLKSIARELATKSLQITIKVLQFLIACTELARNLLVHANGGTVSIHIVNKENGQVGIKAKFIDHGPGIKDVHKAMVDGYSSIGTLGLGLGVAKRAVDDFQINSSSEGTIIQIISWALDIS